MAGCPFSIDDSRCGLASARFAAKREREEFRREPLHWCEVYIESYSLTYI